MVLADCFLGERYITLFTTPHKYLLLRVEVNYVLFHLSSVLVFMGQNHKGRMNQTFTKYNEFSIFMSDGFIDFHLTDITAKIILEILKITL
jgi:hypothetical protein